MDNPTRRKLSLLFKPLPLFLQLSNIHDGTLPLLPSSFTCLNTFSSTAYFSFPVPTVDLKITAYLRANQGKACANNIGWLNTYTIQSIQQDSALRSRRDSFSGSGLSSPALQRSHRDSFSGSPVGHLSGNISLTDPKREERIAGGLRPGLVLPHPHAACPDTRLELDAVPPEAAAISRAELPPTVLDIPETGRLETTRCPEPSHRRGSRSPRHHSHKRPRNRSSALYRPKKRPPHPGHWCE